MKDFEDCFYGSVTVGDRGQVVIPADMRKVLGISAGDRLLVFRHPMGHGLVLNKIEHLEEIVKSFQEALSRVETNRTPKGEPQEEQK